MLQPSIMAYSPLQPPPQSPITGASKHFIILIKFFEDYANNKTYFSNFLSMFEAKARKVHMTISFFQLLRYRQQYGFF